MTIYLYYKPVKSIPIERVERTNTIVVKNPVQEQYIGFILT